MGGVGQMLGLGQPTPTRHMQPARLELATAAAEQPFLLSLGRVPVCQMVEAPVNLNCA